MTDQTRIGPIDPQARFFRMLGWTGVAAIAAAAVFTGFHDNVVGTLQLALFAVASIVVLEKDWGLPRIFDFIFVAACLGNAAGWVWDLYDTVAYYDEAAHLLTTFAFALSFGYVAYGAIREHFRDHLAHLVFAITNFGVTLGVAWEVFEWAFDLTPGDAISDLIFDALGALLGGIVIAWWLGSQSDPRTRRP